MSDIYVLEKRCGIKHYCATLAQARMNKTIHPFNIPNTLTILRLLALIPVIFLFRKGCGAASGGVFLLAMLTDCVDGWYARKYGQKTALGLYLDPVVDKAVILVLMYELAPAGRFSTIVPHLFLTRELLQNAVRAVAARGGKVVAANWMGKTKALLQTLLVLWGLAVPLVPGKGLEPAAWVLLAVSWCFFGRFVWLNRDLFRTLPCSPPADPPASPPPSSP